jgi:uncharacterized membrane protein
MRYIRSVRWSLVVALAVLTGCPGIGSEDTSVLSAVPDKPSYADVAQIVATYCLRCHNATNIQGKFEGDTYELLYASRKKVEGEVDQGLMPPLSQEPMTKVDRETLLKWVRDGAPEVTD